MSTPEDTSVLAPRPPGSRIKNAYPMIGPGSRQPSEPEPILEKSAPSPSGREQLRAINKYVDCLIRFCYHNCPIKMLAVPMLVPSPLGWYSRLVSDMVEVERMMGKTLSDSKAFELKPEEEHWGGYTLTEGLFNTPLSDVIYYRVSVDAVSWRTGANCVGKLIKVARDSIMKNSVNHFISDVRHLMYLMDHLEEVPETLKSGKANVFAGTTVMIGSAPHVIAATWNGTSFDNKFLPLWQNLKEDIQIVMIRK